MKKFLLGLFVLFFIISVNPLNVSASSEEIALSKFNIETTIKEDGSIDMVELITYNFKKNSMELIGTYPSETQRAYII